MLGWLKTLGLEQYAVMLAENGVDLETLRLLTERDLQELGVLLGHRKKLLKAIEEHNVAAAPALLPTATRESKESRKDNQSFRVFSAESSVVSWTDRGERRRFTPELDWTTTGPRRQRRVEGVSCRAIATA